MALILNDCRCIYCGKMFSATIGSGSPRPNECMTCAQRDKDMKRIKHFCGLAGLTIEERVRKIEEWIYDYKPYVIPKF